MARNRKEDREEPGYLSIRRLITDLSTPKPATGIVRVAELAFASEPTRGERPLEDLDPKSALRAEEEAERPEEETEALPEDEGNLRNIVLRALSTARKAARTYKETKLPLQTQQSVYVNADVGVFIFQRDDGIYFKDPRGASVGAADGDDFKSGGVGSHFSKQSDAAGLVILIRPFVQMEGAVAGDYLPDSHFHKISRKIGAPVFAAERGIHNCCTDIYRFEDGVRTLYEAA